MISIIHYISAKRRLEEIDKTFSMMDGDLPPMMLAQRDMIKFEVEYYKEKVDKLTHKALYATFFVILFGGLYVMFGV